MRIHAYFMDGYNHCLMIQNINLQGNLEVIFSLDVKHVMEQVQIILDGKNHFPDSY